MAGRPKKREKLAREAGFTATPPDAVLEGEVALSAYDKMRIAQGLPPAKGNGSYVPYDKLDADTHAEYIEKSLEARRRNAEAKKLATLEGFMEAARENAKSILEAKETVLKGLVNELYVLNENGELVLDLRNVKSNRLNTLIRAAESLEASAQLNEKAASGGGSGVDVNKFIAELRRELEE